MLPFSIEARPNSLSLQARWLSWRCVPRIHSLDHVLFDYSKSGIQLTWSRFVRLRLVQRLVRSYRRPIALSIILEMVVRQSLVAMHRRFMLGVAHGRIDDERQANHAAEISVEPVLVPEALEIQRDRRRGAAEHRYRDRVGQADAERADIGGKQFGLHDSVDRCIAGDEKPGGANQQKG